MRGEVMKRTVDETNRGDWIQSWGDAEHPPLLVWPDDPRPEDFPLHVVAHALARKVRFNGHARESYTVAQHSVHVADEVFARAKRAGRPTQYAALDALCGLFHEGDEVYLPDVPAPLKKRSEYAAIRDLERQHQAVVCVAYSLPVVLPELVRQVDFVLLATEKRDLMGPPPAEWQRLPEPLTTKILVWRDEWAEAAFHERARYYNNLRLGGTL